jgi:hypothetical protein
MRRRGNLDASLSRTLWRIGVVLAATWVPLQAAEVGGSSGVSTRLAQTTISPQPQAAQEANQQQGPQNAETLARELAVAKRDLDTLLKLLNRACSVDRPGVPAKLDADPGSADLSKSLQAEHDRASRLEQDLAAARRDVATQTALAAKASDQACQVKTAPDAGAPDLRKSLEQEHDRASGLEQALAAARRDVATQTALAAKATGEASQLKTTADAGSADLRKSLQQERDRATGLERDLAAARRDVETQTALAVKAGDETKQLKTTADAGSADLRKSLQQERDRASALERDLATARRDVETQAALAAKAGDETKQVKTTAEAGSADLRKSLQQERDRVSALERELATARRDAETQTALAARTGDEVKQVKSAADAGSADLRKALQQELDRASALERDLATARRDLETQTTLAVKATGEASQLKTTADDGSADLRKSLQQERDRASALERDLAAARRDVETQTALAATASEEAKQVKKTTDAGATDLKKSLDQETERANRLGRGLVAARRKFQKQIALAAKAADEASEFKKTADADKADLRNSLQQQKRLEKDLAAARRDLETQSALATDASQQKNATETGAVDLRRSLLQEQERAARLQQDLATAQYNLETQTALAAKAGNEAAKNTADGSAELNKSLQQERDRASRLEQDLAAARRDIETQTALAAKAGDEVNQAKKTAEAAAAGLQASLQQERDRAAQLERDLASVRSNASMPSDPPQQAQPAKPVATRQTPSPDAPRKPGDPSEDGRLVAYARLLLGRGDIGSARIVLQRAAEMGNAEASFALAETYDPLILSKWGTYGTHGDASRALDLYARALAGGIKEAKERSDALHR